MKRMLIYLSRTYLRYVLGSTGLFCVVGLLFSQVLHLGIGDTYYTVLPTFAVLFAGIYGYNLTGVFRHTALSMGCRRKDFFLGTQVAVLLSALGSTLMVAVASILPQLLHFGYAAPGFTFQTSTLAAPVAAQPYTWPIILLLCLALPPIGAVGGELFTLQRFKGLGILFLIIIVAFGVASTVALLFLAETENHPMLAQVCAIVAAITVAAGVVCDFVFARMNARAVVR